MTDPWSDKIFDSLVEEVLTNQHPPDLTEQIQQRWREERGQAHQDAARVATQRPTVSSASDVSRTVGAVRSADRRSHDSRGSTSFRWRAVAVAVLTLAAGLFVAISLWPMWLGNRADDGLGAADTPASGDSSDDSADAADRRAIATAGTPNDSNAKVPVVDAARPAATAGLAPASNLAGNGRPREDLSLENLPFAAENFKPELIVESTSIAAAPVRAWSDDEVVTWLDNRFEALWVRQNVQPQPRIDADAEAARIAQVLTGGALPVSAAPPQELASKLLRSATFAEHWADRVVNYWLRGTPAADARDPAGAQLRSALARQIVARKPWNEIVADLIDSSPDQPESAFLALLAGEDNHRLAGRVGSAVLDEALACARCHDASDNGRLISTDQDEYWSLVAIFTGIGSRDAARSDDSSTVGKQLVDRQSQLFADGKSPSVFFDRPDGRLQAAHYRLPGGNNWRSLDGVTTPRESLARWIASTSVTDRAAVNLAWRLVYGRPLVAQHAALDGEGWTQRREMLDMLAQQFHAHGRDVSRLVGWIIAAEPFRTQPLEVDRQKWLLASDQQIAQWNASNVNFASFPSSGSGSGQLRSLEGALASVVRWSSTRDERRATLAQPSLIAPNPVGKQQPQAAGGPGSGGRTDDVPATYLVRSLQPSATQSEFINRLVASKLTWPQQVEHIAGLVGESSAGGKLQQSADQLLDLKSGDRSAALFQLLQSALLCEEAL